MFKWVKIIVSLIIPLGLMTSVFAQKAYYFPLNRVAVGLYNRADTNFYLNHYLTAPYIPIFWNAPIRVQKGAMVMYERNFFHTRRSISIDWGFSGASWTTHILGNEFYTAALFLDFNWWFIRGKDIDIYFTYSIAGPAFISREHLDNRFMGGYFIFEDLLGVGALLGKKKNLNLSLKIGHYSNGNILPANPGIDVPLIVSLGFAFD